MSQLQFIQNIDNHNFENGCSENSPVFYIPLRKLNRISHSKSYDYLQISGYVTNRKSRCNFRVTHKMVNQTFQLKILSVALIFRDKRI